MRAIDVNLDEYGGAEQFIASMGGVSQQLSNPGPLKVFLQNDYGTADSQEVALIELQNALDTRRSELVELWGEYWYGIISEMVDVEFDSVPIRNVRPGDYSKSFRLRENVIKSLCDRRISDMEHGTVVNIGGNHAQKERFMGTKQEWLGFYLVNRSPVAGGRTIVISVVPARITADYRTDVPDFDLMETSPENELFRLMNETWPELPVFLPFDDPAFTKKRVSMNYEGTTYVTAPKRHFDAVVVLPLTHRIPIP